MRTIIVPENVILDGVGQRRCSAVGAGIFGHVPEDAVIDRRSWAELTEG